MRLQNLDQVAYIQTGHSSQLNNAVKFAAKYDLLIKLSQYDTREYKENLHRTYYGCDKAGNRPIYQSIALPKPL